VPKSSTASLWHPERAGWTSAAPGGGIEVAAARRRHGHVPGGDGGADGSAPATKSSSRYSAACAAPDP